MNYSIKEYDVVQLKEDHGKIPKGSIGTVLIAHDEQNYLVEFCDERGFTLGCEDLPRKKIDIIGSFSKNV